MKCSFCNRDAEVVSCLVAGPNDISICSECAAKIRDGMASSKIKLHEAVVCTFCGVADTRPHGIGINGDAKICFQCIAVVLATAKQANHGFQ